MSHNCVVTSIFSHLHSHSSSAAWVAGWLGPPLPWKGSCRGPWWWGYVDTSNTEQTYVVHRQQMQSCGLCGRPPFWDLKEQNHFYSVEAAWNWNCRRIPEHNLPTTRALPVGPATHRHTQLVGLQVSFLCFLMVNPSLYFCLSSYVSFTPWTLIPPNGSRVPQSWRKPSTWSEKDTTEDVINYVDNINLLASAAV